MPCSVPSHHRPVLCDANVERRSSSPWCTAARSSRSACWPQLFSAMGPSVEADHVEGVTVLGINLPVLPRTSRYLKRGLDLLVSAGRAAARRATDGPDRACDQDRVARPRLQSNVASAGGGTHPGLEVPDHGRRRRGADSDADGQQPALRLAEARERPARHPRPRAAAPEPRRAAPALEHPEGAT